jgi:hypothetical protein
VLLVTTLLFAAAAPPTSAEVDLDGDGKKETIAVLEDENVVEVRGRGRIDCEGSDCSFEIHNIAANNKRRELAVCWRGPRDDRGCKLARLKPGAPLEEIALGLDSPSAGFSTSGNGVLLVDVEGRLVPRREKFTFDGDKPKKTRQPIYLRPVPLAAPLDVALPVWLAPDGKELVGTARAGSTVQLIGAHGEVNGWVLLRLESGITGFVAESALGRASMVVGSILGAG